MKNIHILFSSAILLLVSNFLQVKVYANNFYALDEALPPANVINGTEPVFDFDGDGCLPSAGISRTGRINSGLGLSGGLGTGCRSNYFLNTSNTNDFEMDMLFCRTSHLAIDSLRGIFLHMVQLAQGVLRRWA